MFRERNNYICPQRWFSLLSHTNALADRLLGNPWWHVAWRRGSKPEVKADPDHNWQPKRVGENQLAGATRLAITLAEPAGSFLVTIGQSRKTYLPKIRFYFSPPLPQYQNVRWLFIVCLGCVLATFVADAQGTSPAAAKTDAPTTSHLIEAAGQVEFSSSSRTNWNVATNGLALQPGDRVRTRTASRAAVQLSDRSVIRLSERTTLEILPPRRAEKKRFGLPVGSIFFFNREQPTDVEFDTPLAAGAIRGTEFLLEVAEADTGVHLALIDGLVALNTSQGEVTVQRGEDLRLAPGQPPQKTALLNVNAVIQWALYYPAVINPDDLHLDAREQAVLNIVLAKYRSGDLLAALAAWPENSPAKADGVNILRAQLELAVGRVAEAEALLADVPNDAPGKLALHELIAVVRGDPARGSDQPVRSAATSSEQLAHTYSLQARADFGGARAAARHAVALAPNLGFAHARLAELEFAFGNRRAALAELRHTLELAPRLAPAHALQGFVLLEQGSVRAAQSAFDRARELDAAFSPAWLGSGLCLMQERQFAAARTALQVAAALEPQRGLFRAYLGKAASELGDSRTAEKEFHLAEQLDPNDPTAWLYSALDLWQHNRLNEAIRSLERSADLNDNRAIFRSRLLLDDDRSVRSANRAALYSDVGLPEVSHHTAIRAVGESYENFSGHLFLANSYQAMQNANSFDLRMETTRQSELLVANLLAPPGGGNLSQRLSQQEHLQYFGPRPVGMSSLTQYGSDGDWRQAGTVFGTVGGFSYAFDALYENLNGQSEQRQLMLTLKQRVTPADEAYFQIGNYTAEAGDVANHFNPADATPGFHVEEKQQPTLYAGWHHTWAPGSHTLFLAARLDDQLSLHDPDKDTLFLLTGLFGPPVNQVQSGPLVPPVDLNFASDFTLYSAELQQIWETENYSLIVGGRWQAGDVDSHATMNRLLPATDEQVNSSLERGDIYAYGSWQILDPLRLIAGVGYDHLTFPNNADLPPFQAGETSRELVSPKAGFLFEPWKRGLFRGSYTKSLGGLYFDNSVRLEPTQVAGFNQAFRSLIPESVVGLVPGTEFTTAGLGFDQSLARGTWFGIEGEQLDSNGTRDVGAFSSFVPLIAPATATNTRETLAFRERNLAVYAGQLLGDDFSVGARYLISQAELNQGFPDIPTTATGLNQLAGDQQATLQQLALTLNFHHRSGVFAQWASAWYHQNNSAYPDPDFWQHNLTVGYRLPRRYAEVRLSLLNLFDTDYRLNPLSLHAELPRNRMLTVSLRLNF